MPFIRFFLAFAAPYSALHALSISHHREMQESRRVSKPHLLLSRQISSASQTVPTCSLSRSEPKSTPCAHSMPLVCLPQFYLTPCDGLDLLLRYLAHDSDKRKQENESAATRDQRPKTGSSVWLKHPAQCGTWRGRGRARTKLLMRARVWLSRFWATFLVCIASLPYSIALHTVQLLKVNLPACNITFSLKTLQSA